MIYDIQDLQKRAQFYLALAFAENLEDGSRRDYCIQLFQDAVRSQFALPPALLRQYLEALAISDPHAAKDADGAGARAVEAAPRHHAFTS
jgi:hypothetical protein